MREEEKRDENMLKAVEGVGVVVVGESYSLKRHTTLPA